jgi:hypothetical protein
MGADAERARKWRPFPVVNEQSHSEDGDDRGSQWEHSMSDIQIVKVDEGGVNARILAKETKADFRRVEAAGVKMPARFTSAEGKRFFVRLFSTLQLNAHFISVIARTRLDHDDIARIEESIRTQIDAINDQLNQSIDGAEALFKAHGITSIATYDTVPLAVEVSVLSSAGRRFLEVLGKLDQLMPLLQTLEIHEVLSAGDVDAQRAGIKRQVRAIANGTRNLAGGLRRRMNAMEGRAPGKSDGDNRSGDLPFGDGPEDVPSEVALATPPTVPANSGESAEVLDANAM